MKRFLGKNRVVIFCFLFFILPFSVNSEGVVHKDYIQNSFYKDEFLGAISRFTDVEPDKWYALYIGASVYHHEMIGTSDTEFSPNKYVTREEAVVAIYNEYAKAYVYYHGPFDRMSFIDVEPGQWYSDAIEYAYRHNYVAGVGNGKFGLGEYITRQDMAVLYMGKWRSYYDYPDFCIGSAISWNPFGGPFMDLNEVSDYALPAVMTVTHDVPKIDIPGDHPTHFEYGRVTMIGSNGYFYPNCLLKRSELAVITVAESFGPFTSN